MKARRGVEERFEEVDGLKQRSEGLEGEAG
jgi:hypothetical protein